MNRKPPELHLIDGTKPAKGVPTPLPAKLRSRIPKAEWLDNPDAWDKDKFVVEISDFLFDCYGIGTNHDKHLLGMLADAIEVYVNASRSIRRNTMMLSFNHGATTGANPMIAIRNKQASLIIQLMNELGLSPRGRLAAGKMDEASPIADLLRGPLG